MGGRILAVARLFNMTIATAALAATLSACETAKPKLPPGVRPTVEVGPPLASETWKGVATAEDEDRIARLGLAWQEALGDAQRTNGADIRREGKLLLPRSGLPRPEPTPGSYNCRLIKLGRATPGGKSYETFKPFFCYVEVEGDLLTIVKQTGSQRPAGRLWKDDDTTRLIFLGSLAPGNGAAELLGPVVLDPATGTHAVQTLPSSRWRELCGQQLDWMEALR